MARQACNTVCLYTYPFTRAVLAAGHTHGSGYCTRPARLGCDSARHGAVAVQPGSRQAGDCINRASQQRDVGSRMQVSQFVCTHSARSACHCQVAPLQTSFHLSDAPFLSCSTYFSFCGNTVNGKQGSGDLRRAICNAWLRPVSSDHHPAFASWMLHGEDGLCRCCAHQMA